MKKSNLQSIKAVEFTELGNFNPSQHDSKVWCSFYFYKKVTLGAIFLCSLLSEFSWKTSTFDPFLPLPPSCPPQQMAGSLATTFSQEISRENSDIISKSLITLPEENKKPPKQSYPGQAKLWEKFLGHSARAIEKGF